ncbi:MAG: asparagine synthase (glutamine-hydrolyzing) [Clostridiales bacterium]|nr:asparagine synthase (glutamine-hydrolyzing) [Clostridiales bacterium]
MCAIAGVIDWKNIGEHPFEIYEAMLSTMRRRGPDQCDQYVNGPAALLHARLSVVDLDNGRQPMEAWQGNEHFIIVYNGELYNTDEVRAELIGHGHHFTSRSDTEVLLHAYMAWGQDCLSKLNGIFAFAVWEEEAQRLFIARDRMGVKPFFYAVRGDTFIFASELKTLLTHPLVEPIIDNAGIADIMLMGPGRTPGCGVFKDVHELMPSYCGLVDRSSIRTWSYWSTEDQPHIDTFDQTADKVRWLVLDSIERQLVSDVPLCSLLSGGLDSSILSAVASRRLKDLGKDFSTFSVDYESNDQYFTAGHFQPESDNKYINIMKQELGCTHHTIMLKSEDVAAALIDAVHARDLPGMSDVDSSLLLFCREIKKHATVALSGECADEIFGGYPWFRDKDLREKDGFPWAQSTSYRAEFLRPEWSSQIDAAAYVDDRYQSTLAATSALEGLSPEERRMKEMIHLNEKWFMQTLLDRKDRMSMYSGLEVRVPFCDHRIAEYLYRIPWEMKEYHGHEKGLLRYAMRGLLPDKVLWRKKSPYPKTHHPIYRETVSKMLQDVLDDSSSPLLQLADEDKLRELLATDRSVPWYGQLMTTPQTIAYMVQVNTWMKDYGVRIQ